MAALSDADREAIGKKLCSRYCARNQTGELTKTKAQKFMETFTKRAEQSRQAIEEA